ncbi:MAG TPA: hypothetical protein VGQ76_02435 [Thermoanaerobaculia bacterium]|jgi:hypothetical protein|nr:hypothetical protein [Thermoanaerobaculia bacterium]
MSENALQFPTALTLEDYLITVDLEVHNPADPNTVSLHVVNEEQRYLHIPQESARAITWTITGENEVKFDNPPLTFTGPDPGTTPVVSPDRKSVTIAWANTSASQGRSFFYTLRAITTIDTLTIPITHDPTVHNEPPT